MRMSVMRAELTASAICIGSSGGITLPDEENRARVSTIEG